MRFANANNNFKDAKAIVVNAIIRILINFIQRQIKFYISVIIINVFLLLQIKNAVLIKI